MIKLINLTPHSINVYREGRLVATHPASGDLVRCAVEREQVGTIVVAGAREGIKVFGKKTGAVEGLPPETRDTMFLVSGQVREALPDRMDLCSPGELIRNDRGQPIGCEGLDSNY